MTTLKIYDPAMCCSSGVCGPHVNEELVKLSGFLKQLEQEDHIQVERFNLSQEPQAYASNPAVAQALQEKGTDALPLIFVNDELAYAGAYPPIDKLAAALNVTLDADGAESCSGGCCT